MRTINIHTIAHLCVLAVLGLSLAACSSDDLDATSVVKDSQQPKTAFDRWLERNYLQPYNIELKYRLEDKETDYTYVQVPADIDKSIQLAHIVLHVWLKAYEEVAGRDFIRRLAPKVLVFVGNLQWETDVRAKMGQAESGMKVSLLGVNDLRVTRDYLNDTYFQSMHHEFTHILAQNKDYDADFQKISESSYSPAGWYASGVTETYALQRGFMSPYAMSEYNEDFAETLAFYLIYTADEWAAKLRTADTEDNNGSAVINQKLTMIRNYMQTAWGIDIDQLRAVIQRRMSEIVIGAVDINDLNN